MASRPLVVESGACEGGPVVVVVVAATTGTTGATVGGLALSDETSGAGAGVVATTTGTTDGVVVVVGLLLSGTPGNAGMLKAGILNWPLTAGGNISSNSSCNMSTRENGWYLYRLCCWCLLLWWFARVILLVLPFLVGE